MSPWLEPVARALDARRTPASFFVRDDDAGWADDRLFAVLDLFESHAVPIDLAVIPTCVNPGLADALLARITAGARVGLHQHGYRHANHEVSGRPCEFGPSRSAREQDTDVISGQQTLRGWFGVRLDAIFTPPWNRCTADTGAAIARAGLTILSRDRSAGRLGAPGVAECPIDVDWFARRQGERLPRAEWAVAFAQAIAASNGPLGLMLHHTVMDVSELDALNQVLSLVARHPGLQCGLIREVAPNAGPAERSHSCASN